MADESVSMDKTQPCGKHSLLSSISSWFDFELCSNCSEEAEFDVWSDPFVCVGPDAVFNACGRLSAADFADQNYANGVVDWPSKLMTGTSRLRGALSHAFFVVEIRFPGRVQPDRPAFSDARSGRAFPGRCLLLILGTADH